jgi:2-polyprenyl-3-methyl-5-hydroxy-6-metoxy-1,4-benzoquinol methylase
MMKAYGGALRGGMPLYKYVGNRILSALENRSLGMQLTEFHSGYRAYDLHTLRTIDFSRMTDDFHFDTEIIIKLQHQCHRIKEVPIPTYYGSEICHVNGLKYAKDVTRSVYRYRRTCDGARSYPEFQEYFVHYPIKESRYSSHSLARQFIAGARDVLDVGCGRGAFAADLTKHGSKVIGIDILPDSHVDPALEAYHRADLDAEVLPRLMGKRFDRVLLMDVLEHLKSPERLLRECREILKEDGSVIVSLPNVANVSVRLMLLFGRFNYTDRGILDRTHLRFFTRRTARRLLADAGFRIVAEKVTVIPVELVLGAKPGNLFVRSLAFGLAQLTKVFPGLLGYQFVFKAEAAATTALRRPA